MVIKDPKSKTKQDKSPQTVQQGKSSDQRPSDKQEKRSTAFDPGVTNNANTQAGTAQSGYDEKNPKHPGGKQQHNPKVTNQENDITNSEAQNKWSEEPVDEQSSGNSTQRTDPEIDSPIPDSERTEKKIPKDSL
ncbi:hypothetical protein [Paraflavitalea sp. CAU 1676]|uniref:hypothetical protein n=1 Tax=Paraflavitalea sp. CAU 1676 TaxID=3032598 RepID=UPI0023DA271E|nr:hypothetical protein [Paraflavitalea sp. CAU 1676]MDF2190280.1 hypothetical protein [Paraflavitalea sp. CAU 1676]